MTRPSTVTARPYSVRFTVCASCRAAARWWVSGPANAGTTCCDRHKALWMRRAAGERQSS